MYCLINTSYIFLHFKTVFQLNDLIEQHLQNYKTLDEKIKKMTEELAEAKEERERERKICEELNDIVEQF